MTVQDIVNMNDHDKQTIYEAYSLEAAVRKKMNEELNKERRLTARLSYEKEVYFEKWLRYFIKDNASNLPDNESIENVLDDFFSDMTRKTFMTPSGGMYCTVEREDCIWITFAWANKKMWREESKDMLSLIKSIANTGMRPIRYTGKINFMKNHSIQLDNGDYELKF